MGCHFNSLQRHCPQVRQRVMAQVPQEQQQQLASIAASAGVSI